MDGSPNTAWPPAPEKLEHGDPFDNDAAFALERYGYDITDGHKAVEAFRAAGARRRSTAKSTVRFARSCSSCC